MSEHPPILHHTETAQIIQFADARRITTQGKSSRRKVWNIPHLSAPAPRDEEGLTETCKNLRLRQARQDVWREADAVMDYRLASMKMESAIHRVQYAETSEGALHPVHKPADHWTLVVKYRKAWARLMLTPAPSAREITWKRAQLKAEKYKHTDLKAKRIEQAIADDVEFLKAHPTRRRRDQEQ